MNSELPVALEHEVLKFMKKGDMPGLSLVIIHEESQVIKSYGYSDIGQKKLVTPQTLFELGSCSKAFTALAVMHLEQEGKIKLSDPIAKYLPELYFFYEDTIVNITLRQLLHHTSGIPWSTMSKIPQSESKDALEKTVFTLIGQELEELPGRKFEYATINYDVLALIIERVTGSTFESFLQNQIINKLELSNTSVGIPMDQSQMSKGYKIGFFKPREYETPIFRGNYAAGYVISNAVDMAKWLKFQLGLEKSSFSDLIKRTHERDETVPLHQMASYASGWNIALDGTGVIFHSGLNPNFASFVALIPKKKIGIALLTNSNSSYPEVLVDRLIKTLANDEVREEWNPGDLGDRLFSSISIGIGVYILVVFGFIILVVTDIFKGRRKFKKIGFVTFYKFFLPSFYLLPVALAFYLIPESLYGFTWEAILIWAPTSLNALIIAVPVGIGISYLSHALTLCFAHTNKYLGKVPLILLMSILSSLSNVVVIILVTSAIGSNIELQYSIFYFLLTVSVYLAGRRFVQVSLIKYSRDLVFDLQNHLIQKIFAMSYQKFEKIEHGKIYTTLNDDVNVIGQSSNILVNLISSIITTIGAFVYLSFLAFWATILMTFLILTISVLYYYVSKSTNFYFEEARNSRSVFMGLLNGLIDGYMELSLHSKKKMEFKDDIASSADEFRVKTSVANVRFVNAFLIGESLLLILLGATSIGMSHLFPGIALFTILSFVIIVLYLIGPINGILGAVPALLQLRISWIRVQDFTKQIPVDTKLSLKPIQKLEKVNKLEFTGVKYNYESDNGDNPGFKVGPLNFTVSAGEILFIIGGNGSGKTTLAKLLTGLYSPSEGTITINNTSVRSSELGEFFSVVFNPLHLFEKLYGIDLGNNISLKKKKLKLLDLEGKVKITNNKYDTINLSGGQRKRLALLRCYLEDSSIYLFDEWAADQDPIYRKFFYRTLLPEMKSLGKVVIAITHDDHYFDSADKIIKMNQGKIEEINDKVTVN
ncbi:MAG: cyclic peptide export ABC transporter [Cyclobacteriaceae bacterium]